MSNSLETLEQKYREAREAFLEDGSDENLTKYKKAKAKFALARVEQRQGEEADPNHPRGNVVVVVNHGEEE